MTIAEFLLARIAEDEAVALAVDPPGRPLEHGALYWHESRRAIGDRSGHVVAYGVEGSEPRAHIARHDPARVLAECEAKRAIVEHVTGPQTGDIEMAPILGMLSSAYADHPDYNPEWRVETLRP